MIVRSKIFLVAFIGTVVIAGFWVFVYFSHQKSGDVISYHKAFSPLSQDDQMRLPTLLVRKFILGEKPAIIDTSQQESKSFPGSVEYRVVFRSTGTPEDLLAEYEDYLKNTLWRNDVPPTGFVMSGDNHLFQKRAQDRVAVFFASGENGTAQVTVILIHPKDSS